MKESNNSNSCCCGGAPQDAEKSSSCCSNQAKDSSMTMENVIRVLAGTMVLISITLAHFVSQWWLLLGVFVGCNLIQSAFTSFCPAEIIFRKLGIGKGGCGCKG